MDKYGPTGPNDLTAPACRERELRVFDESINHKSQGSFEFPDVQDHVQKKKDSSNEDRTSV